MMGGEGSVRSEGRVKRQCPYQVLEQLVEGLEVMFVRN